MTANAESANTVGKIRHKLNSTLVYSIQCSSLEIIPR